MSFTVPQIEAIERAQMREVPAFRVGDTIKVHFRIREGDKERIQVFEGVVLRRTGGGLTATFTVRKVSYGVGVERIFPVHSPRIEKIEIAARGHVRRARLYYLRELKGKKARLRQSKKVSAEEIAPGRNA
jgi:large subunit ribosomal protein L19